MSVQLFLPFSIPVIKQDCTKPLYTVNDRHRKKKAGEYCLFNILDSSCSNKKTQQNGISILVLHSKIIASRSNPGQKFLPSCSSGARSEPAISAQFKAKKHQSSQQTVTDLRKKRCSGTTPFLSFYFQEWSLQKKAVMPKGNR